MTTTEVSHTLFEKTGRVGVITLNRPDKLNAWTDQMQLELVTHVAEANEDPDVGAIVITGAGRGFCAGRDLTMGSAERTGERWPPRARRAGVSTGATLPEQFRASKPIVAAINGVAVGVGVTMPLNCDIRLASDRARFSLRFVRIGLSPEYSSSFLLPQVVGLGNAADLLLTGRFFEAPEALSMGLVSRVIPHEQLMDAALALAAEIASGPTQSIRFTKTLLYANMVRNEPLGVMLAEDAILNELTTSPPAREAAAAFREKREPDFRQFDA